jgi:hypothetical protein
MSLHNAAKHLESKGRNGDTMLVHMTPGEVRGLQALALAKGGSLSVNPDTGLVEANFLKKMLPTIAGLALTGLSGGAINPLTAGMLVGGFEGVRTGDLGKGLMAGLGAYGGAGIGQGLATAGQAASGMELGSSAVGSEPTMGSVASKLTPENADYFAKAYETGAAPADSMTGRISQIGKGIGSLGTEEGRSLAYNAMPKYTLPAAGMSVANAVTPEIKGPAAIEPDEYDKRLASYRLSPNFSGYVPPQPNPYYRPTGLGYAAGGDVMMAAGGTYDDEPSGDMPSMAMGGVAAYSSQGQVRHLPRSANIPDVGIYRDADVDTARKDALEATMIRSKKLASGANMPKNFLAKQPKMSVKGLGDVEEVAAGGSIGGYSDGGRMLKGPGDGMSDSIPATIGKRQPARLADGEFVVPADVVSHLGNGSTDAGAKRLYSMMDKVRKARTGKKKQAPAVKADKYMPA